MPISGMDTVDRRQDSLGPGPDPTLRTWLVGVANSAFYRRVEPVESICDAIIRIGSDDTRHIAMAISFSSSLLLVPGFQIELDRIWQHSLLTAHSLHAILRHSPDLTRSAFLLGLVHDVGKFALMHFASDFLREQREDDSAPPPSPDAIQDFVAGIHGEIGGLILESWRFWYESVVAVERHHALSEIAEETTPLARALCAADLIAHKVAGTIPSSLQGGLDRGGLLGGGGALTELAIDHALESIGLAEEAVSEVQMRRSEGSRASPR